MEIFNCGFSIGTLHSVSQIYVSDELPVLCTLVACINHKSIFQDVLLEIQGQAVAGYTQADVIAWINHCSRNSNPVVLKTAPQGGYRFCVTNTVLIERFLAVVLINLTFPKFIT